MKGNQARLKGPRFEIGPEDSLYPDALRCIERPPAKLYGVGDPEALQEGLAIIGARKATPYGKRNAQHFSTVAAEKGIVIISGGAYGCDSEAHKAAIDVGGKTVAFLGGGCDVPYPIRHVPLFQRIIDAGGAVVSENAWEMQPMPYCFRERNRLIAGLAKATLIVEAGLPSGTFSTADAAIQANRDVLAIPGAITSPSSRGANLLIAQGAIPIIDDESFEEALFSLFGCLQQERCKRRADFTENDTDVEMLFDGCIEVTWEETLEAALAAEPLTIDELFGIAHEIDQAMGISELSKFLIEGEIRGEFLRYPDGRIGVRQRAVSENAM